MNERTEKKRKTVILSAYGAGCLALIALLALLAMSFYAHSPAKDMGEPTKFGITQTQEPKRAFDSLQDERAKAGPLEKEFERATHLSKRA